MDGRLRRAARNESGYTLTELITVATIVGIIASIAVPFFLGQRQSSWRSAAASDVRSTAMVVETVATDHQLPAALVNTSAGVQLLGEDQQALPMAIAARSSGVRLDYHRADDEQRYCLCGYHEGLGDEPAAIYDSGAGGFVEQCTLDGEPLACTGMTDVLLAGHEVSFHSTANIWGAYGLSDGPSVVTEGSLRLSGAQLSQADGATHPGGWALAYGVFDGEDNRMSAGYTVQFDRALDAFVVNSWGGAGSVDACRNDCRELQISRRDIPALAGTDSSWWTERHEVAFDVSGGQLRLTVDDEPMLAFRLPEGFEGGYGVRTWSQTSVDFDAVQLVMTGS